MRKLHVHLSVKDVRQSAEFYTKLFNVEPVKQKDDYVKWSLDNPPLNFAISQSCKTGLDHLGIEVGEGVELENLYQQADESGISRDDMGETVCCYARSEKSWIRDPQGIQWELFHTTDDEETFHGNQQNRCCNNDSVQQCC